MTRAWILLLTVPALLCACVSIQGPVEECECASSADTASLEPAPACPGGQPGAVASRGPGRDRARDTDRSP